MKQMKFYGDERTRRRCVHCGDPSDTLNHVPSKVLMDEPFPDNIMTVPACYECNNEFSIHEEYVAFLLECIIAGSANPQQLQRPKIARILQKNSSLLARLQNTFKYCIEETAWADEYDRVEHVALKLARCHAAFELNEPQYNDPSYFSIKPLPLMMEDEREAFEHDDEELCVLPEVGSRAMQRVFVIEDSISGKS
jgi:hypothetical protein